MSTDTLADILAINRHPAILGAGGRGGAFNHEGKLIPLEINGDDHRKWRRLLDPMFGPKKVAFLEEQIRTLARELVDQFRGKGQPNCTTGSAYRCRA